MHNIGDTLQIWAINHMVLIFVLCLIAIAICKLIAVGKNSSGRQIQNESHDLGYHLEQINNNIQHLRDNR
jgi:hypothetical protein